MTNTPKRSIVRKASGSVSRTIVLHLAFMCAHALAFFAWVLDWLPPAAAPWVVLTLGIVQTIGGVVLRALTGEPMAVVTPPVPRRTVRDTVLIVLLVVGLTLGCGTLLKGAVRPITLDWTCEEITIELEQMVATVTCQPGRVVRLQGRVVVESPR